MKKHSDIFSEGNAAHPTGCDSPLLIFLKSAPNSHYLQRAVTPNQLRPDSQANTRPSIFFKANVTTSYRKEVVRKSRFS